MCAQSSESDVPQGSLAEFLWLLATVVGVVVVLLSRFGLLGLPGLALLIGVSLFSGWCSLSLAVLAIVYVRKSTLTAVRRLYWSLFAMTVAGLIATVSGSLAENGLPLITVAFTGDLGPTSAEQMRINLISGPALLSFLVAPLIRRRR
jgi:hypothetical protein